MDAKRKALLMVHAAVLLFGFTGILGAVIQLSAITLVWWRALLTWIIMLPMVLRSKENNLFEWLKWKTFLLIGLFVAFHWVCFYGSIKLANSSVAMICLATIPVFTAICEGLFNRKKINRLDLWIGIFIIPGIILIVGSIPYQFKLGFAVGILAALLSAVFATLNKKFIHKASATEITLIEMISVWLILSLVLPFMYANNTSLKFFPDTNDFFFLFLLVVFCTVLAYVMTVKSLKNLTAFTAMLAFNMEPVYGIILSIVILQEHKTLNCQFYTGVVIILASIFIHPILQGKYAKS